MPDLPTITVTTEQQTRILNAIKDQLGGGTNAEAASAYRKWLAKQIKNFVLNYERKAIDEQANSQANALFQDIDSIINESSL